jgi:hypothetical protein
MNATLATPSHSRRLENHGEITTHATPSAQMAKSGAVGTRAVARERAAPEPV